MGRQIALAGVAAWLVLLAALFIHYQFGPFVMESKAPGCLLSLVKVSAVLLACAAFGLKLMGRGAASPSRCLSGLAVGLAVLALAGFAMGVLGILNPYTVYALVGIFMAVSRREVRAVLGAAKRAATGPLDGLEAAFAVLIAVAVTVGLINCLSPVTANDALVYHLNLPRIYSDHGGMVHLPFNVYANMPHYGEVIYAVLYSIAGETGVVLLYFAILVSASLAAGALVARAAPRVFGLLAAAAFLVQPLVLDHRVVANIDVLLAFVYLAAIGIIVEKEKRESALRSVIVVSALAGFMMGVKYMGIAPALSLLVLMPLLRREHVSPARIALGLAVAAAVFSPWPIRQALETGNPFYPMLEARFDGANWDDVQEEQLVAWQRSMGMGRSPAACLALPFNVSVRGRPGLNYRHFDGTISPVFLMLFPLALVRRRRTTTALALTAVALGAFWALTSQQLRFLLPALGLLAVSGALGLAETAAGGADRQGKTGGRGDARSRAWATFILLGVLFVEVAALAAPNQYGRPWLGDAVGERLRAALGLEPADRFLERTVQPYSLYRQADEVLPRGEGVFMIWENRAYHLGRPYLADSFFEASTVMRIVARAEDARDLRDTIEGLGYRYVLVNDLLGEIFARRYPPQDVARLRDFIQTYLEPLRSANKVTLYRLGGEPAR